MSSNLEGDLNGDGIVDEMDRVRSNLGGDIDQLGVGMRKLFDWQSYVRSAPLTSVGAALVVGYLIAPRVRSRPAPVIAGSVTTEGGITRLLTNIVLGGIRQAGSVYLGDLLTRGMTKDSPEEPESFDGPPESAQPF